MSKTEGSLPAPRHRPSSEIRRVQIAAARARITLDGRRGIETPQWIVDLANEKPPPRMVDRRVQIAAAKARVTLDSRRGIETPRSIVDLANEKRP